MPKFAANLSMLFTEQPFLDRFESAARAGFDAVEFQFPYAHPVDEIRARVEDQGLKVVLHNLPGGDWEAGERGLACLPHRQEAFRQGVATAIVYAERLEVRQLNCVSGKLADGLTRAELRPLYLDNLRYAARELKAAGIALLLEPINVHDVPGFYLNRIGEAIEVIDELAADAIDNLFVQYDLYHAQRTEGELAATLSKHLSRIAHVQIADNPGRHEPGSGEINFDFLFGHLDRIGYRGHVGCEYVPANGTEAGLGWLTRARASAADRRQR